MTTYLVLLVHIEEFRCLALKYEQVQSRMFDFLSAWLGTANALWIMGIPYEYMDIGVPRCGIRKLTWFQVMKIRWFSRNWLKFTPEDGQKSFTDIPGRPECQGGTLYQAQLALNLMSDAMHDYFCARQRVHVPA